MSERLGRWRMLGLAWAAATAVDGASGQAISEQIVVNQIGWRPEAQRKIVIFADPVNGQNAAAELVPGPMFEVHRASDGGMVFSGPVQAWNSGATHGLSGDRVWFGDFSSVSGSGDHYIVDPANNVRSHTFLLSSNVFNGVLRASTRTFYYQRCGTEIPAMYGGAWTHGLTHLGPNQDADAELYQGGPQGMRRDVRGGWWDAGDYNKYVPFVVGVMWDLMSAVEWFPDRFGDATGIPESGNGVPDLVDELKWELDWLLRMQVANGSVCNRVAQGTYNIGARPENDTQPRYYTQPTTWATATFAAATARGSRLFQPYEAQYPGFSAALLAAAEKAWDYLEMQPTILPANGTDGADLAAAPGSSDAADDKRRRILAAAELFRATGQAEYRTYFDANYNDDAGTSENGHHPIADGAFDASTATVLNRAFVSYAEAPGATPAVVAAIRTSLLNAMDWVVVTQNENGTDPYRAFMWDGHYTWGSNSLKCNWANLALYAVRLNIDPDRNALFDAIAEEYLHYLLGRNPLGWCYLSNAGSLGAEKSPVEIYHGWFQDGSAEYDGAGSMHGPAPGYLVGGPNQFFPKTFVAPPYGEPAMKAYRDWNTGWNPTVMDNENSWEVTEPAIYYQAAFTLLAARFAGPANGGDGSGPGSGTVSGGSTTGSVSGSSAGSTSGGMGGDTAGAATAGGSGGVTGAGDSGGGATGGSSASGGGGTGATGGMSGGGAGLGPERLPWRIVVKFPKANAQVRLREGVVRKVRGLLKETGLEKGSRVAQVQWATRTANATGAPSWSAADKVGRASRSGRVKFKASNLSVDPAATSGAPFEVWLRASDSNGFDAAVTETTAAPYVVR